MAQESKSEGPWHTAKGSQDEARAVAQAQFDALLGATVDPMIVIGGDGRIQIFNPAAERVFGYRSSEVVGENVNLLMPEPFRGGHDGYLDAYRRSGVPKIIGIGREVQALKKDGTLFPIALSVGHARMGGKDSFVGIARDLTLEKQAEAALDETRRALTSFVETFPGMVYRCESDALWTMTFVSGGALALTGYTPSSFVDGEVSFAELIHPDDLRAVRETVDSALEREEPFDLQYRLRRRSGEERWVFERGVGVLSPGGDREGFIEGFIEDITDRVLAEREANRLRDSLAHLDRLSSMGEMAAGIAHELNQPLTAISSYAQASRFMLQKGGADPDRLQSNLEKIRRAARHGGEVIQRLRALMKKRESERREVSVNALVLNVLGMLEHDTGLRNLTVQSELAEDLPPVMADEVQLHQVLLNLLRNAIDATEQSGASRHPLRITTRARDLSEVEVAVRDHGVGISQEVGQHLFHPFFTTKPSGLGLGLSICQSIVEAHGGHLAFTSHPGGGATFRFTLPTAVEATRG